MEIRVLRYFLMVAREENITKAANLLHLTQPTLSRQLMQLEEELGVTLFRRSKHRIILTEDGCCCAAARRRSSRLQKRPRTTSGISRTIWPGPLPSAAVNSKAPGSSPS